jgi:hypothetical protein
MKISAIYLLTILSCFLLLSSCDKETGRFANGDLMASFGVVEKTLDPTDNNYIIHLDNGDQFISVAMLPQGTELAGGQRVQVTFSPYDEKIINGNQKIYYGRINGVRKILLQSIVNLSAANTDSIGNDPVTIRESWVTGDSILTVNFNYLTNGSVHSINLAGNIAANGTDQPFILEFRHNAGGDQENYRTPGVISFNLNPLKMAGQHKTDLILRYRDYEGKIIDIPHTINY